MERTVRHIEVPLYEGGEPAHDIVPRVASEVWVVPRQPIQLDRPIEWTHYAKDTQVMIPLLPYLVDPEPAKALAFMAQLGLYAGASVGRDIRRIHLSIGHPVQQLDDPRNGRLWQVQIGFGLILK